MSTNGDGSPPWGDREALEIRERSVKLIARVAVAIVSLILIVVLLSVVKGIYTDLLWFGSLDFRSVYTKILWTRVWLFFVGTIVAAILLAANLYLAFRFSRGESILAVPLEVYRLARSGVIAGTVVVALVMSVVFGFVAQGRWETFLVYFNRVPFGIEDPQFHKDMSFHVAVMPMFHFIQGWFMGLVIAILVAVVALYLAIFALRGIKLTITPKITGHVAILGAFLMLTIAAAHYLDIFELVFSGRGAAPGAGYTDVNARLPVLWLLVAIALVSAAGFVLSNFYGGQRLIIASFSLWAVLAVLAGGIYPTLFQRVRVRPNEFTREEQYIDRAIQFTRAAYQLDVIEEKQFAYTEDVTAETIENNPETISNIRLWDHRPLRQTYNQIQTFRQYYTFVGVDVDRYRFPDGDFRQVMLSARELSPEDLELDAQNWVNRKLAYTHGFGVAMSPVTDYTEEGRPEFFLKNVPPEDPLGRLKVSRPEVYYGENTKGFVIVNSETEEFDFPGPEGIPQFTNYAGIGGVKIGSFLRRIAYSWQLLDFNILISGQITGESRVQYRREIQDRVSTIAPFLHLDSDPYLVLGDTGRMWWIQDAYTTTDRYAYSQNLLLGDFNYIRNSVKVVIDAYNGTVHFFIIEPEDPLIQIYDKAFPDMFKDFDRIDELDTGLRDHIRYPIDLFAAQAEINLRYHMRNPQDFFLREDLWATAREVFETSINTQDIEPYYIIMKLPGEEEEEFVLLLPFTPGGVEKKNMVGWMAARSDGENYGKLVTFLFPKNLQVFGPEQIEGRITGDDEIGKELSLLCPEGKLCIRGNLLAIPIDDSVLYVEPLYIRAQALPLPELKKVIVADANKVVMTNTLCDSLGLLVEKPVMTDSLCKDVDWERVLGVGQGTVGSGTPAPDDTPGPGLSDVRRELDLAGEEVERLRDSLTALEEALRRLNQALQGGQQ